MSGAAVASGLIDTTIRVIDQKGKIVGELQKILKDVTVEEFKKILVNSSSFGKLIDMLLPHKLFNLF